MVFGKKCDNCGAKLASDAKFCSDCGNMVGGAKCGGCGTELPSTAKFCPNCGSGVKETRRGEEAMKIEEGGEKITQWSRKPMDFAKKIELEDIKGFFRKGIVVEQGIRAMFVQDGRLSGVLPAGKYNAGGVLQKLKDLNLSGTTSAILVDDSDVIVDFDIGELRTKDSLSAGVKGKLVLKMESPELFLVNYMKGREDISLGDLEESLRGEMKNILQPVIKEYSFEDLYGNLDIKREIGQNFEYDMKTTLDRWGINFIQMPYFDYDETAWQDIIKERGDISKDLTKQRDRIKQEAEKELMDYERQVSKEDRRLELARRARESLTEDKIHEIKNEEDLAKFIHGIDKDKLVREDEMTDLKRIFSEKQEDKDFARKKLLERLELEHKIEQERGTMKHKREMEKSDIEHKIEMRRLEFKQKMDEDWEEHRREMAEAKDGIDLLRQMKGVKRDDEITRMKAETEVETQKLAAQAEADVKKMQAASGMTEEQILALMAKNSPEIAKAFQEKFKGMSAEEQTKIYREFSDKMERMAEGDKDRIERMGREAMAQMGKTAESRARGSQQTVVAPGGMGGQPVIVSGQDQAEKVVVCGNCKAEMAAGTKFCTSCGGQVGS